MNLNLPVIYSYIKENEFGETYLCFRHAVQKASEGHKIEARTFERDTSCAGDYEEIPKCEEC